MFQRLLPKDVFTQDTCDQYWANFVGHMGKWLCSNDMLCALEKLVMAEVSEHVECSYSTTKYISLLQQCLWPLQMGRG